MAEPPEKTADESKVATETAADEPAAGEGGGSAEEKSERRGERKGKGKGKGKGGGGGKGEGSSLLAGKSYEEGIEDICASTQMRFGDMDQRAVAFLDFLGEQGKADEAVAHLKKSLTGISRDKVSNWRGYVYTLLKAFDRDAYNEMKEQKVPKPRREKKERERAEPGAGWKPNTAATEFVPGGQWQPGGA